MSGCEWIHCSKCYALYNEDAKFYVTECGHLNCQMCVIEFESNGKKCLICNRNTTAVLLTNDIRSDIKPFFSPIEESIDRLENIIKFQTVQKRGLLKHMCDKCKEIDDLKKRISRLESLLKNHPMDGNAGSSGMGASTIQNEQPNE